MPEDVSKGVVASLASEGLRMEDIVRERRATGPADFAEQTCTFVFSGKRTEGDVGSSSGMRKKMDGS